MKKQEKKEKKNINRKILLLIILAYFIYVFYSCIFNISSGIKIGSSLLSFLSYMIRILPCAFIIIGLFEVWVPRKKVEKYLGYQGGFQGYFWAIVLAGTMAGGLMVALPVSSALYHKGARLSVIFTFLGAAAVVRIPMTLFEASFLGAEFTAIRWVVSLPLIIISSLILEKYLVKQQFQIK